MTAHDRNMIKRADIERFQEWLNENNLAWRPGKGEYQLMQVKLKDGWPAICTNAQGVVTTPPALREMIQRFRHGLPYTGKTPRKTAGDQQFLDDLRDDFAMAALQGLLAGAGTEDAKSDIALQAERAGVDLCDYFAVMSYNMADAMMIQRAKRAGGAA